MNQPSSKSRPSLQEIHFSRAKSGLRETIARHVHRLRSPGTPILDTRLQAALQQELGALSEMQSKLDQSLIRIAAFGLVSRGKSAVLNALMGQRVLQTGPLNGVTQWPRSIRWTPSASSKVQIELIDTPGLDEVDGQARAAMAKEIAQQADLILFIVAGDITRTEYDALCELRDAQKPLILVFNKIDLYPDQDRQAIYSRLRELGSISRQGNRLQQLLSTEEIVMVAAEPAPLQVRNEWPDGRVTHDWESPPPQIDELKLKLLQILNREGRSLLALNALRQAREVETSIAQKTIALCETEAEALIWRFTRYKALAIGLNPVPVVDVLGGIVADLAMIRALAKLYGLPITRFEAITVWKSIAVSSGTLLLGELASSLLLGFGKTTAAVASAGETSLGLAAYGGTAIVQAGVAGYGAYIVGRATQVYLERGCTWGPQGANTLIQEILSQVEPNTILYRLRQELQEYWG
ncbi:MAG: GTP-binding protein [Leptolyngbyaceae cyanobacterium bins.59]|nr:GTP-binding protein [Leptolyngbyaceae cyanobacterium bins.59]